MSKPDPLQVATIALMSSLTDVKEWTEKRLALFDENGKFVALIPSNTHYGAVNTLCRKFHLTHKLVDVKVTYDG
jgi:hypothetical protein